VISQLSGGRLITLDHFHHRRDLHFVFTDVILDMYLLSLNAMLLPKLPFRDLQNALSIMVLHTALILTKNSLHSKRNVAMGLYLMGLTSLIRCPNILKVAGLIEQVQRFFEVSQCQPCHNTLQYLGKVLQKVTYSLNQLSIYGSVSPIAKFHESRNHRVKMGWYHLPSYL
jgi:hypothetical protein